MFRLHYSLDVECSPKTIVKDGTIGKYYRRLGGGAYGRALGHWDHALEMACGALMLSPLFPGS